jgi:hypothetical protein
MPVTNTQQARIELSRAQYKTLAELLEELAAKLSGPPMLWLEETNLDSVVWIGSNRGSYLIAHDGSLHTLGYASENSSTRRPRRTAAKKSK